MASSRSTSSGTAGRRPAIVEKKADPDAIAIALLTGLREIHSREGTSGAFEDRAAPRARTTAVSRP
ncbi:hypothetical protein [Streptomyces sp. NPDC058671]|uniref:hypothetical protein n=1 Tax=Streptomyces sp. NPDC058671 TaxID=3346590 RepID=UPI0036475D63